MGNDRGLPPIPRGIGNELTTYLRATHEVLSRLTGLVRGTENSRALRASDGSATTGTATASIEQASVLTRHLADKSVTGSKLADGCVTAIDMDLILDAGAYQGLSSVVLQRGLFCCLGVYNIENFTARARAAMTNTPNNGAFRGFGAPQTFFAIELLMGHIAKRLGEDIAAFKLRHFVKQGDKTSTSGLFHERVPVQGMLSRVLAMAEYGNRLASRSSASGRYRRGIGFACVYHGCGFTGNGERDIIKAKVRLEKQPDGSVDILAANTDMGQGIATTLCKIVMRVLDIPMERIRYGMPDTAVSPDSGPTVASRSLMIVGRLLERAAARLKENWREGEKQVIEEDYVDPPHRLPFDMETFHGDAYPAYSWAVNVVEVEVDMVTMRPRTLGVWAVFDCGTPIDLNVLRGQAEGGILQGIGHASSEMMDVDAMGRVRQKSLTDYILPTAADAPPMQVEFYEDPYYDGPFGARGAGELTVVAAAPAYAAALEDALGITARAIPMTPERILAAMRRE